MLKFTHEIGGNKINFLDVNVAANGNDYTTAVYKKPTNTGIYLNANSECPERYKISTIRALIHRTYKISSTWQLFNSEVEKLKQAFINNGYSNNMFDNTLRVYLNSIQSNSNENQQDHTTHTLF